MEPRTSQLSGQVRAKTKYRVVGMDPMAKQTHLVSSLIRDVPTGLSHEDSAATGSSTNQTIHTSSDSATLQSGWIGCNIIGRRFLKELSNVSEVIAFYVVVFWAWIQYRLSNTCQLHGVTDRKIAIQTFTAGKSPISSLHFPAVLTQILCQCCSFQIQIPQFFLFNFR